MTAPSPSPRQPRPPAAPEPEVDPADEAMRLALAAPTGPAAHWRPGDPDPLAEGLLMGFHTFAKAAALAAPAPGLEAERALIAEAVHAEAARPADPATLPRSWRETMMHRAEAGRARIERHNGTDVAVFEPLASAPDDAPRLIASALPAAIRIAEAAARAALPADAGPHLRDEAAEREAIPRQSNWRPPAWAEAEDAPRPGDWCGGCRGQRWWRPADGTERADGTGPAPGWRCAVCRPVPPGCETAEVRT